MIDKADYALLNAVSVYQYQAYLLNGGAGMEAIMNAPSHGLGRDDLIEHFYRLWNAGLLECSSEESGAALVPDVDLVRRQFEHAVDGLPVGPMVFYRLSKAGGDLWEHLTSPDWTKFLRSGAGQSESTWILGGGDRMRVELLLRCGDPVPVPGTERWEVCAPWRATYWKTVERGYELSFETLSWGGVVGDWDANFEIWRTWDSWCKSFDEVCRENSWQG